MQTINDYVKKEFGEKLYKLAISGEFTCPNRDGKCGVGGCIFCSEDGSGDFAETGMSITEQIEKAKELGCLNTHFTNPSGIHDKDHYTTAYDMAVISKADFYSNNHNLQPVGAMYVW